MLNTEVSEMHYAAQRCTTVLIGLTWCMLLACKRFPLHAENPRGPRVRGNGCAKSPSYGAMGLCRAITAFFISPAGAIGSAVVQETFFKHERAKHMGVWTLFVTLGVPTAPFIFGFVALRVGYRWR